MIRKDDPVGDAREARGEDRWQVGDLVYRDTIDGFREFELFTGVDGPAQWLLIDWRERDGMWIEERKLKYRVYKADASGQQASDEPATGRWS